MPINPSLEDCTNGFAIPVAVLRAAIAGAVFGSRFSTSGAAAIVRRTQRLGRVVVAGELCKKRECLSHGFTPFAALPLTPQKYTYKRRGRQLLEFLLRNPRRPALHVAVGPFRQSGVAALFHFVRAGFTTIVPLIDLPWILQWYLNSPPSRTSPGSTFHPVDLTGSNVLPSSSDVAV